MQGFRTLLDFEGNVEECYDRTFQAEVEIFGTLIPMDLKENGASIKLNNGNRQGNLELYVEFVDLYVNFILNKSVEEQFNAFKEGFDLVCGGTATQLFRAEELELLVCGASNLNFEALEKVTLYDGGYTAETPVIRY